MLERLALTTFTANLDDALTNRIRCGAESGDRTFSAQAHPGTPCRGLSLALTPLLPSIVTSRLTDANHNPSVARAKTGGGTFSAYRWVDEPKAEITLMKLRRSPLVIVHVAK